MSVDDERLDPLWATGARLGLPIVVHVADPIAFFDPLDERNERWEELAAHPDWHFWPPRGRDPDDPEAGFTPFDEILAAFDRVLGRHPETTFIGAHVGCAAEDLALVSSMLERHPNFHVDIAARIAELGRQPYTAREFFLRFADRILFGTDQGYDPEMYRIHYRFLETWDESFDYSTDEVPPQGRWQIHGLGLPDDVLRRSTPRTPAGSSRASAEADPGQGVTREASPCARSRTMPAPSPPDGPSTLWRLWLDPRQDEHVATVTLGIPASWSTVAA